MRRWRDRPETASPSPTWDRWPNAGVTREAQSSGTAGPSRRSRASGSRGSLLILLLGRTGRGAEASARAGEWLGRSPNEPHAWYAQGIALSLQGQHGAAREAFSRAIGFEASFDPALRDRGASALALGLGLWSAAAVDFERVVSLHPESAQAWRELGYARERGGERLAALRAYEASLRLEPNQPALADYVTRLQGSPP